MWHRIKKWFHKLFFPTKILRFKRAQSCSLSGSAQFNQELLEKFVMAPGSQGVWYRRDENGELVPLSDVKANETTKA